MSVKPAEGRIAQKRGEILEGLNRRYATKKYDPEQKVSAEDWEVLEQALLLAPSSFGLQPFVFYVVTDPAVRQKLQAAAFGQSPVAAASHLVVFAYQRNFSEADVERFVERVAEVRGQTRDSLADFEQSVKSAVRVKIENGTIDTWASRQAYIALGFLLETAALMGIDATPMEGFDPAQVNEILGLRDEAAVAMCAVGYRHPEGDFLTGQPKVRLPKEELIKNI